MCHLVNLLIIIRLLRVGIVCSSLYIVNRRNIPRYIVRYMLIAYIKVVKL